MGYLDLVELSWTPIKRTPLPPSHSARQECLQQYFCYQMAYPSYPMWQQKSSC